MQAIINILQAGVASGTVLLFASLGEIMAERSGVMNLGVEGMMLMGAMSAYSVAVKTGNPWLGVLVAMLARHIGHGGHSRPDFLHLFRPHVLQDLGGIVLAEGQQQHRCALGTAEFRAVNHLRLPSS